MPVSTAARDLSDLLAQLPLGETVTLLDENGKPVGLLVSLQQTPPVKTQSPLEEPSQQEKSGHEQSGI
jgi:antitoxin (DNA-binding transcriptional repressor) of toxin-antitoxin stability system